MKVKVIYEVSETIEGATFEECFDKWMDNNNLPKDTEDTKYIYRGIVYVEDVETKEDLTIKF